MTVTDDFFSSPATGTIYASRFVTYDTTGAVKQASAATDKIIAVSTDKITSIGAGDMCDYTRSGRPLIKYGGTVTVGQYLTSDSTGRAVSAVSGNYYGGVAIHSGIVDELKSFIPEFGKVQA